MKAGVRWIFWRLGLALIIYSFLRLFFLCWNFQDYSDFDFSRIAFAFLHGIRFDLSTIMILSAPFLLIWLFLPRLMLKPVFQKTADLIYCGWHILFFAINVIDTELSRFNGQRLTANYFSLSGDILRQFPQLILNYWHLTVLVFTVAFVFLKFQTKPAVGAGPLWKSLLVKVFCLMLVVFAVRGGTQNKPLKPAHAYVTGKAELGTLSLNSSFTFIHSRRAKAQPRYHFMEDSLACGQAQSGTQDHVNFRWDRRQNVILIIMESFALEYMGRVNGRGGYTPFLDDLAERGLFFKEGFANGRRSIEALPSIVASVPSLLAEPFLMSGYQGVGLRGLPQILLEHGYDTAFFHGAINGSMFFDSFAARIGFEKYFGRNEYVGRPEDDDGFWGILDEPFFQFAAAEMDKMAQPFFSTIFSLSSHQPYPVPDQYKNTLPKGELEIHQSVAYADLSLKNFFATAVTKPWFEDTLFVITADHTQLNADPRYKEGMGPYRVPIILFHPQLQWPKVDSSRPVQHADIEATILDILNIEDRIPRLVGRSVFGPWEEAFVVNRTPEGFWGLIGGRAFSMDFSGNVIESEYRPLHGSGGSSSLHSINGEERFKAFIQCFIGRILDGNLHSRQSPDNVSKN